MHKRDAGRRRPWPFLAALILLGCNAGSDAVVYSSVRSPSGRMTAMKEYHGEEAVTWSVSLISTGVVSSRVAIISNQPLRDTYGSDGVILAWTDDQHLTLAWPKGTLPLTGPTKAGDVAVSYRAFDPDPDRIETAARTQITLQDTAIDFKRVEENSGAKYVSTGQPVPHIQCIVRVQGREPKTRNTIAVELIGDSRGRREDPYPSPGMMDVRFSVLTASGSQPPAVTQAKVDTVMPTFRAPGSQMQSDASLLYKQYQAPEAHRIFSDLVRGSMVVTMAYDFGKEVIDYHIALTDREPIRHAITGFNECAANTNLYLGRFQVPLD